MKKLMLLSFLSFMAIVANAQKSLKIRISELVPMLFLSPK
jgi:hypothetical protein